MIRFILCAIFLILFLILSIPILIVEWIIGKFNMPVKNTSSLAIVNWAFGVIIFISGAKVTVRGEENVPKDQAVLYVANHNSYFDILLTYVRVPRPTGYIAKKEMLRYPLLRDWMKNLHCKFLDRQDLKEAMKMMVESIGEVKKGISICIFPEGTRNKTGGPMAPFKEGSLKIAEKTGCPIIPIAISGTADIFENHMPKIKKAPVIIEYGKPIIVKELPDENRKFVGAYTREVIQQMLATHDLKAL